MSELPELTNEERAAFSKVEEDFLAFLRWRKQNHEYRDDIKSRLPIVYNGKSVEEWYTLYCQQSARTAELIEAAREAEQRIGAALLEQTWSSGATVYEIKCVQDILQKAIERCP